MMLLAKNDIRQRIKVLRSNCSDDDLFSKSVIINQKLFEHPYYKEAKMIGFYVSKQYEVETILLMEQALKTKRIAVPKVEGDIMNFYRIKSLSDLQEGHFHVFEPTTPYITRPNKMDLIIVPLVAFNRKLYRIGYGKGFYDKYLKDYQGHTIGLAFSFQEVDEMFEEEHDLPLDVIITEKEMIKKD